MGQLEKSLRTQIRKSKINSAIITAAAVTGGVTLAVLAPNLLSVLGKSKFIRQQRYKINSSLSRLLDAGYIMLVEESGTKRIRLTPKGEKFAALLGEGKLAAKKPRRWDGKWRILVFDIPEKRRAVRTKIRSTLRLLGFVRLQDSVWVYPYDCEDFITILKADFKIGKDVLYVIADKIEFDKPLRAQFRL